MWIIEVSGKKHVWGNDKNDDFLQYLPAQFGVDASEIKSYWVDVKKESGQYIKIQNDSVEILELDKDADGNKKPKVIKSEKLKEMDSDPYERDISGNYKTNNRGQKVFKGNSHKS